MNIFILDNDPVKAAKQQCDKHVVKMVLETAQMLCGTYCSNISPYKTTHYNHPCSIWSRQSKENYMWLIQHGLSLSAEYTERYGKVHKSQQVIEWCRDNMNMLTFEETGLTPFAQAVPEEYKNEDPVVAYRSYYLGEKAYMAKWKQNKPEWWTQ